MTKADNNMYSALLTHYTPNVGDNYNTNGKFIVRGKSGAKKQWLLSICLRTQDYSRVGDFGECDKK